MDEDGGCAGVRRGGSLVGRKRDGLAGIWWGLVVGRGGGNLREKIAGRGRPVRDESKDFRDEALLHARVLMGRCQSFSP